MGNYIKSEPYNAFNGGGAFPECDEEWRNCDDADH